MRGIIVAAEDNSNLYPISRAADRSLFPVYDKPLIYYPLATLMAAGIREILIVCHALELPHFRRLFGEGGDLGVWITYKVEPKRCDFARAALLAADFADGEPVAMIAGDNVFLGDSCVRTLKQYNSRREGLTVFTAEESHTSRFGTLALDRAGFPCAEAAVRSVPLTGLMVCDRQVFAIARRLAQSKGAAFSTRDLLHDYLARRRLFVAALGNDVTWFSCDTPGTLLDAAAHLRALGEKEGIHAGVVEEIAFAMGYIDQERLRTLARRAGETRYAHYLYALLDTQRPAA